MFKWIFSFLSEIRRLIMSQYPSHSVALEADDIPEISSSGIPPFKHEKIEEIVFLLLTTRLGYLKDEIKKEFLELKERQDQVAELHKILQSLKSGKGEKGDLDISNNQELKTMLDRARELGVDIPEGRTQFTKDQVVDLFENIRMSVEDLNTRNDMQLQKATRLTSERYESFQLARAIMKPLHDDKQNKARSISSR